MVVRGPNPMFNGMTYMYEKPYDFSMLDFDSNVNRQAIRIGHNIKKSYSTVLPKSLQRGGVVAL